MILQHSKLDKDRVFHAHVASINRSFLSQKKQTNLGKNLDEYWNLHHFLKDLNPQSYIVGNNSS